jgi:hypothetical protein
MNGQLIHDQTSENNWGPPVFAMLHERAQADSIPEIRQQRSIFEDLERQMAQQEAEFADSLAILKQNFIFTDIAAVEAFLKAHRMLIPILLAGMPSMKECFGEDTPLALEIMSDDGPPTAIYALALWRGERTDARAALTRFDELWWLANLRRTGGRIVFDYELV